MLPKLSLGKLMVVVSFVSADGMLNKKRNTQILADGRRTCVYICPISLIVT
jgi:hypothetical protein